MQVSWAQSLKEARALLSRGSYDCAVLDRMLPDGSGVDLCSHIKATTTIPVILQTAKNQLDDKVEGFGVGADDYLAKPYDLGELVLRIHAVTQRNALQDRIQWRNFTFDFTRGDVMRDGEHIHLSATQLLIIQILFAYRGAIVTRSDLLDKVR